MHSLRSYRPDIDGLRAVAILSVVLYHAGVGACPGGFTGVDVFFVISGYLIGGQIHSDIQNGTFSYIRFYQRRAKRILPALYAVLIAILGAGFLLLGPDEFRRVGQFSAAAAASVSNVVLWLRQSYWDPAADTNPLLMTWSLGVEEHFYVVIPVLMVLLSRVRKALVLPLIGVVIIVSFTLSWTQLELHPMAVFYLLHTRAWELSIGLALAILESNRKKPLIGGSHLFSNAAGFLGLVSIAIPCFVYKQATPFPGPAAIPSVIGTALLIATRDSSFNRRILSSVVFVFIGRASYSFYLWHWPVFAYMRILNAGELTVSWGLLGAVASFGLAVLSYYAIEQPFRASDRAAGPLLLRYVLVSAGLIAISLGVFVTNGVDRRFPVLAAYDSEINTRHGDGCISFEGESKPQLSASCYPTAADKKVVLWGDSHAAALAPVLRDVAARYGYAMAEVTKTACEPLIGAARNVPEFPLHVQECIAFNDAVMERISADSTVGIVVMEGSWGATFNVADPRAQLVPRGASVLAREALSRSLETIRTSLHGTVAALRASGKIVVVLGDYPSFDVDPVWRYRTSRMVLRRTLVYAMHGNSDAVDSGVDQPRENTSLLQQVRQVVKETARSVPGVIYWDLRNNICSSESLCTYRVGEDMYYDDGSHVSPKGAEKALRGMVLPTAR